MEKKSNRRRNRQKQIEKMTNKQKTRTRNKVQKSEKETKINGQSMRQRTSKGTCNLCPYISHETPDPTVRA